MPIKINSFGGIPVWALRKNFSAYTSKAALEFASKKYAVTIGRYIERFDDVNDIPLFKLVNIETINRCNGTCAFCPANVRDEKRVLKKMEWSLYEKIVKELKELAWSGTVFLNVNNEPLLDHEIVQRARMMKQLLGDSVIISMFTNGTMCSLEKLEKLAECVDVLVINNYSTEYRLNEHNKEIYNYVKKKPEKFKDIHITINRRYLKEILTTRAGNAPNKKTRNNNNVISPCIYPYTDITIFPDGKVGLCCNDCFEVTDYGNLNENSMKEIWTSEKFKEIRKSMKGGRLNVPFCKECDVMDSGIRGKVIKELSDAERCGK